MVHREETISVIFIERIHVIKSSQMLDQIDKSMIDALRPSGLEVKSTLN